MKFVPPHDPILRLVAEKIPNSQLFSDEMSQLINNMFAVAYGEQSNRQKPVMVGLAAPQIGIPKRIILVDVKANGKGEVGDLHLYLNPEIIFQSEETNEWYEGCYSTSYVCGVVSRPTKIKLRAVSPEGQIFEEEHEGYTARIFQHEIDHLDGKVFVDHITNPDHLHHVEKDEFPEYRNHEGWRNWPKKVSFEEWKKIKGVM